MNKLRTTAIALATVATAAMAQANTITVAEIDVKSDLSDFANSNALEYWPDIEKDLNEALMKHVEYKDEPFGDRLVVKISDVSLNGNPMLPQTGEFNRLEGAVVLYDYAEPSRNGDENDTTIKAIHSFPLSISAVAGDTAVPAATIVIPPSKDDFYTALVEGFALAAVDNLK